MDHLLFQFTKSRWGHVSWWQLWSVGRKQIVFRGMENAPCLCTFQKRWEPGGLRNPQRSALLSGMDPSPHSGEGPGGVSKAQSVNASSIVLKLSQLRERQAVPLKSPATKSNVLRNQNSTNGLDDPLGNTTMCFVNSTEVVFAAIPPCSTIEITCNQVNFLRIQDGTKSKNELLGDAFLLGVIVADKKGEHCKVLLPAHWWSTKWGTWKNILHDPSLFSFNNMILHTSPCVMKVDRFATPCSFLRSLTTALQEHLPTVFRRFSDFTETCTFLSFLYTSLRFHLFSDSGPKMTPQHYSQEEGKRRAKVGICKIIWSAASATWDMQWLAEQSPDVQLTACAT